MNETDVRAHSHGVNESMSNTDSDKKQRSKLRKRQLKRAVSTGKYKTQQKIKTVMEIKNQFQLSAGPKFSNPLKPRAFGPRFIDAGPPCVFQHWQQPEFTAATHGCVRSHRGIMFPRKHSCPLKEEPNKLDGTYDIADQRSGVNIALCFSLKRFFRTTFREGFVFSTLVQMSTWIQRSADVAATSCFQIPQKQKGFCYMQ